VTKAWWSIVWERSHRRDLSSAPSDREGFDQRQAERAFDQELEDVKNRSPRKESITKLRMENLHAASMDWTSDADEDSSYGS